MGEILIKMNHSFFWWIKIAIFNIRKFLMNDIHKLANAVTLTGVLNINFTEIPIGVNIEISPLNHFKIGFFDQFAQGIQFGSTIRHTRKNEIIDGSPAAHFTCYFEALNNIVKGVIIGAVILGINIFAGAVGAYPDAV